MLVSFVAGTSSLLTYPALLILAPDSMTGWSSIEKHLELLEMEKLIVIKKLDRVVICITSAGIEAIETLTQHLASNHLK